MNFVKSGKKIVAIGRNYAKHAVELQNPIPSSIFFFLKPTSSYIVQGQSIEIPRECKEIHHEVELGVVIGKRGRDVEEKQALDYVAGYCLALDMTARSLQETAKKAGLPWTRAKGYDTFCPVSRFIHKEEIKDPQNVELWLKVDGELKQRGNTNMMLFKVPLLISTVSSVMTLEEGDVILTGTPEGVGPVLAGSVISCGITGLLDNSFPVISRTSSRL